MGLSCFGLSESEKELILEHRSDTIKKEAVFLSRERNEVRVKHD